MNNEIILASTSPFRRELLQKLGIPFHCESPNVDESPLPGEKPEQLARRLAENKASAVASKFESAWVIGSDQVATIDGKTAIGKPGNREKAISQLMSQSGKIVTFYTGLCLQNKSLGKSFKTVEPFRVNFRLLTREEVEAYVDKDEPYGCAGSFKSEGLGISLFQSMEGSDPSTLIGLPLIQLNKWLIEAGLNPLLSAKSGS